LIHPELLDMADARVPNLTDVIKGQTYLLEKLHENLYKLEALLYVGMQANLSECSDQVIEGFLWTIRDLIIQSKETNQAVLQKLMLTMAI